MREDIVFKGVNGQLQLVVNNTNDFTSVLEQLRAKLKMANEFFHAGTVVKLPTNLKLARDQQQEIIAVLSEHGLKCEKLAETPVPVALLETPPEAISSGEREGYEITALVVNKTLRSGQKVVHDGSVVVIGDVNPGAQVIAGEDIIIMGACRGVAHAGANGNEAATITAAKILATQLRIAGLIARAPDKVDKSANLETARIKDGTVIIEPANR